MPVCLNRAVNPKKNPRTLREIVKSLDNIYEFQQPWAGDAWVYLKQAAKVREDRYFGFKEEHAAYLKLAKNHRQYLNESGLGIPR